MSNNDDRDPRAQIRADLLAAARRRVSRRRRRRMVALATVAGVGLLATTAGALAIGGYTTGFSFVDRTLERSQERVDRMVERSERRLGDDPPAWAVPPKPELRPGPGGASEPIEFGWLGDDSRPWVGLAYENRDGAICFTLADRDQRPDEGTRLAHGCVAPKIVAQRLEEQAAFASCSNPSTRGPGAQPLVILLCGYARGEVASVRAASPHGDADAKLTPPWTPDKSRIDPLRFFVGFVETDVVHDPRNPRETPSVLDGLSLEATLTDGTEIGVPLPELATPPPTRQSAE